MLKLVFFMRDYPGSMVEVPPEIEKIVTGRRRITMPTLVRNIFAFAEVVACVRSALCGATSDGKI